MNVAILGASGGCGRHLVTQALERGHQVTAVVRASSSVTVPAGAAVKVLRGDLTSADFLRQAVRGQDAVLTAVGLKLPSLAPWAKAEDPTFLTRLGSALVSAMKAEGVGRVVAISAGGVGDSEPLVPGFFRFMLKTTALATAYAELNRLEQALLASGLDVCIPRPTGLTDGPRTGKVVVTRSFAGRATISRADVADWMLAQLDTRPFAHRTPMITVTGAGA